MALKFAYPGSRCRIHPTLKTPAVTSLAMVVFAIIMAAGGLCFGASEPIPTVGIAVSRQIRPYLEALDGLSEILAGAGVRIQTVHLKDDSGSDALFGASPPDLLVGVGPEATRLLWEAHGGSGRRIIYSMVLNPEALMDGGPETDGCGVPLNIPVRRQLQAMAENLPGIQRVGILYDPAYNVEFFAEAEIDGADFGLTVVPLPVSSRADIPRALRKDLDRLDALWMIPDRTVISESIVQYVIKEALLKNVPVIGYNRFFIESGAALAFVIDYKEIGRQAGRMVRSVLAGDGCGRVVPAFESIRNDRVLDRMGWTAGEASGAHDEESTP